MKLLAIDTETTGLDFEEDRITEIGYVIWDTDKHAPVHMQNFNLLWADMPELSHEIVELTGIDMEQLELYGLEKEDIRFALATLHYAMQGVGVCVAHNAPFDRGMLDKAFALKGMEPPKVLWIDTYVDLPYPKDKKARKLIYTAAEHGLNPIQFPHRALFDTLKMLELLDCYDINDVVTRAKTPNITLQAMCKKPWLDDKPDGEKDTDIAKQNGFHWKGNEKTWTRNCKEFEAEDIKKSLPFPIKVIENAG